ncbi:MAG: hypothetical protein WCI05_19610 [Myxococcales bacterium]
MRSLAAPTEGATQNDLVYGPTTWSDPNTDFVFYLIFGSEDHKKPLLGFSPTYMQVDCVPNQ